MTEPTPIVDVDDSDGRPPWVLVVGAVVALALIAVVILLLVRDDDETAVVPTTEPAATSTPTSVPTTSEPPATSAPPVTSAPPATSAPTTPPTTEPVVTEPPPPTEPPVDGSDAAIWPWVSSDLRFTDPVAAATSFAVDFIGFDDPVVGEFQQGDELSGEVEVRPFAEAIPTVVFVRTFGDSGEWFVIGAANQNIVIEEPDTRDVITSPVEVAGAADAFEGTVIVQIRADGVEAPLFESFVTGQMGQLGSFSETFEWDAPTEGAGSMVFLSLGPRAGEVIDAGAIRVFFGQPG